MLKTRILTALLLIPAVLAALFLLPSFGWALATLAVVTIAAQEWSRVTGLTVTGGRVFTGALVVVGAALLGLAWSAPAGGWVPGVVTGVCGVAVLFWLAIAPLWVIKRWSTRHTALQIAVGFVVLLATWVALVELQARSPWLVLAAMAVVWIADTAAYFTGRAWGRHKLAPLVSPGKSWEGVYGAWVAVLLYAWLLSPLAVAAGFRGTTGVIAVVLWLLFVFVMASASVVGDLYESLMKRQAGVKDSGTLLPGHGGILDRIDALLAAMPLAALATQWFLVPSGA
ncbi:MAG: phosphatidate cytidylyltransferase [Betaproteobacteria bacterium]